MHLLADILRNSILITGLVVVMMMMIESINIESRGLFFAGLKKTRVGQVVIGALLGSIPGCMGGFATVSLYTHRMFSFGALVAMMIASSGDEAFMMLAMIPHKALLLFVILFIIAVVVGIGIDLVRKDRKPAAGCDEGYAVHYAENQENTHNNKRTFTWKRFFIILGLGLFIVALATGNLGHDHTHIHEGVHSHCDHHQHGLNILSEDWMNVLFAGLAVIMFFVLIFASDHFVEDHIWKHIVRKHLPVIFLWTFGVLLVLGAALQYLDISQWISDNTALMIVLATLVGIIPESGPHLVFVTLYATGIIPFPVLLASSISQDGHASIPLLAENKRAFLQAKTINCLVALAAGFIAMIF